MSDNEILVGEVRIVLLEVDRQRRRAKIGVVAPQDVPIDYGKKVKKEQESS